MPWAQQFQLFHCFDFTMLSSDAELWPEKAELERWLMNTVKDPDPGAMFLRQVLQMNPAYGGYLQSDKDGHSCNGIGTGWTVKPQRELDDQFAEVR
eukprot:Skav215906  [mRNA]  locus=scaffold1542:166807:168680:- [translate_table: standard]